MGSEQAPVHDLTRTEAVVAAHDCDWAIADRTQGQCRCGLIVHTEDQWRLHIEQAVID